MEHFRSYPTLCALFLSQLDRWGAKTMDWTLLADEGFVDLFLRRLVTAEQIEPEALVYACSSLTGPSPGGVLAGAALVEHGRWDLEEYASFLTFALKTDGSRWPALTWLELSDILERGLFAHAELDRPWLCAALFAFGWVPAELQARAARRVWQTNELELAEKRSFEDWLAGLASWPDLPSPPHTSGLVCSDSRLETALSRGDAQRRRSSQATGRPRRSSVG